MKNRKIKRKCDALTLDLSFLITKEEETFVCDNVEMNIPIQN